MSKGTDTNRWWENYLVRYFMPSIAGVVIVNWLATIGGPSMQRLLLLPCSNQELNATSLTLLFLYGNLFCYIASYPILCFHASRVLDFANKEIRWPTSLTSLARDGYFVTITLGAILVFITASKIDDNYRRLAAFFLAIIFSGVQLWRLYLAYITRRKVEGLKETVSPAFGFTYSLARRRGVVEETSKDTESPDTINETSEKGKLIRWRKEIIDTYRHMREHGNSAFIFLLELILAAICYCVISGTKDSGELQLSTLGILFAIWATPSLFVHLAGQHIERRFSTYDSRLNNK